MTTFCIAVYESYLSMPVARYPHFERMSWVENNNMTDLPKSPFQVNFFRWRHFEIAFYEFYLSTLVARYPQFESMRQHDTDYSHWLTNFCWSLHTSGRLSGFLVFFIIIKIVIILSLLVLIVSIFSTGTYIAESGFSFVTHKEVSNLRTILRAVIDTTVFTWTCLACWTRYGT